MKKDLVFTEKEAKKLHILKEVIEWRLKQREGADTLWISDRQMRNLQRDYKIYGETCVIHWLKNRIWNHTTINKEVITDIAKEEKFAWFWPTLLQEHLLDDYNIQVSTETVRQIMIEKHLWDVKDRKHHIYRQARERKTNLWMMSQFDWSYHKRFEERNLEEYCALVAIDDATGRLLHVTLWENEWFACISKFWIEYILKHWIPETIYLDKFSSYKVNHQKAVYEKHMITNFDRIMRKLWCRLIFANSPQAKWRVEKCNDTLQDRLVKEMRLRDIDDTETANRFIEQEFIPSYNKKFAVPAKQLWDKHIKNTYTRDELNILFSKVELRSLGQDYVVQYKNRYFQVLEWNYTIYPKKKIEVHESYTWVIQLKIWEITLQHKELDYTTTKRQRTKFWYQKYKIEQEKQKKRLEELQKARYEASKLKQSSETHKK